MRVSPTLPSMIGRVKITVISSLLLLAGCGSEEGSGGQVGVDTLSGGADVSVNIGGTDSQSQESNDALSAPPDIISNPEPVSNRGGSPKIAVDPESYSFSYVSPMSQTMVKQVNFFNGGYAPLVINKIEFLPGGSQDFMIVGIPVLPITLAPGKQGFVNVGFMEKMGGEGTLRISSNDADRADVDIVFSSVLKAKLRSPPQACAGLSPSALNFGTVVRGDTKVLSTKLTNCSDEATLTLKSITRSSFLFIQLTEEFQLKPSPATPTTLGPGETLEVFVEYAPKLAGLDTGYFSFNTDDPTQPQVQLDLSAMGEAPPPEQLGLTITLNWDSDGTDVDSHFIAPGGTIFDCDLDCHYGNPSPDWGVSGSWADDPFLDVDDVDGYGPENINVSEPQPGTYTFVVHYYQDSFEFSQSVNSNASVEVSSEGKVIASFGPEFLDVTNRTWDVFTIEWPSKVVTKLGNTYMLPSNQVQACLPFSFP